LKKGEATFRRNQEILLLSHQDKRLVNMISTLHTAEVIETTADERVWQRRNLNALYITTLISKVLIKQTSIWLTTHSFVKLSNGPRSIFLSSPMLPFQQLCYHFKG